MLLSGLNVTIQELVNDLPKELRTIPTVSGTNADVYFSPSIKNAFSKADDELKLSETLIFPLK